MSGALVFRNQGNALARLGDIVNTLLAIPPNKLKLHQVDLASLRRKGTAQRPAAISVAGAHTVGTPRHFEGFVGIGLRFQLRKVLERGAVGRFVKLGDSAEYLTPPGIHHSTQHLHSLIGI